MSYASCGEYTIISKLGKGTFGDVQKVQREKDGKLFAMKQIRPIWNVPPDKLEREVNSHKSLPEHENIVQFVDYFRTSGYMNIVLELCDRGTLEDYIASQNVELETAISFMLDMARGLSHLHANGIVHRDIKPENILLSTGHANVPRCKISDFGVANMIDMDKLPDDRLGSLRGEQYFQTLCGTPLYLAPEVRDKHYTKSCDIFSLGVVYYILFSPQRTPDGRLAPWAKNGTLFYKASDREIVEQVREYVHNEEICALIVSMMTRDYHERISAKIIEEKLQEIALTDDEVFFVACLFFAICVALLILPLPLFVICLALLVFAVKVVFPKSFISTYVI